MGDCDQSGLYAWSYGVSVLVFYSVTRYVRLTTSVSILGCVFLAQHLDKAPPSLGQHVFVHKEGRALERVIMTRTECGMIWQGVFEIIPTYSILVADTALE